MLNWRGRPLTSHEVVLQTIAATTSHAGLTVHAELDSGQYPTGIHVSDHEIAALPVTRHRFHGTGKAPARALRTTSQAPGLRRQSARTTGGSRASPNSVPTQGVGRS
jgi:Rhodopirellula transposase DDE domain